MTGNGQTRLHIGQAHEHAAAQELTDRGWHVQPWGQGLLDDPIRLAFVQMNEPVILWRWLPDLIAQRRHRGRDQVLLVDPKTDTRTDTPYFSIELQALMAHKAMTILGLRIVYIWGDMTCNYCDDIRPEHYRTPTQGQKRVASGGSGTPFALVRKDDQLPLDNIFGHKERRP